MTAEPNAVKRFERLSQVEKTVLRRDREPDGLEVAPIGSERQLEISAGVLIDGERCHSAMVSAPPTSIDRVHA